MTQGDSRTASARSRGLAWPASVLAGAVLAALAAGGLWIAPRAEVERGTTAQRGAASVQLLQAPAAAEPPIAAAVPVAPASTAPVAEAVAEGPEACALFLARLPSVTRAQCEEAQLRPSGAVSAHGVPLFWRDVPAPAMQGAAEAPLRVLIAGAIHGDELTAAALALRWIALAEQAGRPVHWRFIPVLNPDGLLARPATRTNGRGVDLNRNFPTPGWEKDAPLYWDKRTRRDPRRFPGHAALSEPESQFLHAQMAAFQPHLIVSIHAPYGVLDFDGPLSPPERLGRLWLDQVGIFPGSLGNYGGVHRGMPVVTIELPHALNMPADAEVRSMWRDLLRWMGEHWPEALAPEPKL